LKPGNLVKDGETQEAETGGGTYRAVGPKSQKVMQKWGKVV
jgi:hypothetical protein